MDAARNIRSAIPVAILVVLVLLTTFYITNVGPENGFMVTALLIAGAFGVYSLINYKFGFYTAIVLGHIIFFVDRLLGGERLPTAFLVDIQINATFLGLIIHKVVNREVFFKNSNNAITYAYALYTLFLVIELFNPEMQSVAGWFFVIRKFLQFIMIYIVGINMFSTLKSIRFFFVFWGICAFITGLYGCYQQWFGLFNFEMDWIWSVPGRAGLYALDNGDFRKFSLLSGPAAYGIIMGASALLLAVMALRDKDFNHKVYWTIGAIFSILGMAYAGTRTAYFIFTAGAVLYILMTITNRSTLLAAVVCFMGFVVIMWGPIYGNVTINRIRSTFDADDSSLGVRDMNRASIQPYIHSHPLGGGLASSGVQGLQYNPNHYLAGFPPDSGFVKTAVETGWIGFFLQCLLYCIILLQGVRAFYRTEDRTAKVYALAAVVTLFGFVISQYGQVSIGQIPDCFLFYSLLAIIVRISKLSGQQLSG
jgi:putative inorganic carbon (hco3(-)) transporter